jgi:pimeloyl-ACP methyl ester carboxylesterase
MGGLIAQLLALRHPGRVSSLILGCTHPGGREAVRMDPAAAAMLMDRTPRSIRATVEASVPFVYADATSREAIERDIAIRIRWPVRAKTYWAQLDAMRQHEGLLARLGEIRAPTLVMHGSADKLVQPANASLIASAIPSARLVWLDGASHVFWTDQPQRTLAAVTEFVGEVDIASA